MFDYVCRQDSYFLTEGKDLLNQEFSGDFTTYFSILQVIANGKTKRSEIDSVLHKDMGTYLQNLESRYELINRMKPLLAKKNGKVTAYEIHDNFLRFWFRFIYPYQSLIERNLFSLLRSNIENIYANRKLVGPKRRERNRSHRHQRVHPYRLDCRNQTQCS